MHDRRGLLHWMILTETCSDLILSDACRTLDRQGEVTVGIPGEIEMEARKGRELCSLSGVSRMAVQSDGGSA